MVTGRPALRPVPSSIYGWLLPEARATLAEHGVTVADYYRLYGQGDRCGCPDDRCIGYHHETPQEPCDLRYWLEEDIAQGRLPQRARGYFL